MRKDNAYEVTPLIRQNLTFNRMNLAHHFDIIQLARFDVIFCRHVLRYFEKNWMLEMIKRLYHMLEPGGFLFLDPYVSSDAVMKLPFIYAGECVYQTPWS
ncbi:MAG: hypothetical protein HQM12_18490 [SAR324 cluster bacterium]|nr:hypothetical protein [SAR324 cluster bacterium]